MRRRVPASATAPPASMERFRMSDWWDPAIDPLPPPYIPYATADDRYVWHGIQAHHRWSAAREAAKAQDLGVKVVLHG